MQVLTRAETGEAQPLLRVTGLPAPGLPPSAPREEHLIPYVPQIVPLVDLVAGARLRCLWRSPWIARCLSRKTSGAGGALFGHPPASLTALHAPAAPPAGLVFIQPPPGLLDLGRQRLLMKELE